MSLTSDERMKLHERLNNHLKDADWEFIAEALPRNRIASGNAMDAKLLQALDECNRQPASSAVKFLERCGTRAPELANEPVFLQAVEHFRTPTAGRPVAASLATPALTILHVSDLHFGQARGDGALHFDQLKVVDELVADARTMAGELGAPDLILVTGDIAYSAQNTQYTQAKSWLEKLAGAVGCGVERIFLAPGNHDVDRDKVKPLVTRNVHDTLRAGPKGLDNYLLPRNRPGLASALWPKLQAYAKFSSGWGAPALTPSSPFWRLERPSPLGPLVLIGLNTCLLSYDGLDAPSNLALGKGQIYRAFEALPENVLVLTAMHHPPEWLEDGGELIKELRKFPSLLFSGHIHHLGGGVAHPLGDEGLVRFSAGAGHAGHGEPERHSYAWVQLSREGIRWYPRAYNPYKNRFSADGDRLKEGERFQLLKSGKLPGVLERHLGGSE